MFTNELLTKEFPHERPWEALVRSKSGNLTLTNQAGMGPAGLFTASTGVKFVDKDTSFEAMLGASGASTLEFKYLLPGGPMRGLLLMSRFERVKIAAAAAAVKQSDGSVKAIAGPAVPSDSVEFGVEYVMPAVTAKLSIDPFLAAFKSSLTLACTPNVKAGMDVSGGLDRGSILKYGGGLMYTEKGLVASLQTLQEGTNPVAGVAANFQIRPEGGRSELVGEWKYSLLTSAANATFAGRYMLDDKTELRARITPDAKVALNVTHLVSPLFSAGLGVQVDPQLVLADKPEAVRWGIKLAFEQ